MNFNTANQTFRQLLGNGLSYRVPPFQRDYSWGEDEWDDLWQDLLALLEIDAEPAHYMGYLVLQSSDNKKFEIIDGQQCLTTLSLLVLAALACLQDLIDKNIDPERNSIRLTTLRSSYIGYVDPVSLISRCKLELNRHNNNFYQSYLVQLAKLPQRGLNSSEHQLRRGFIWLRDHLHSYSGQNFNSGEKIAKFIDLLVDKLFFTVITVTDELNAFKVFETLNARGVRLSATDLLKNYLFSIISSEGAHDIELQQLENRWEHIVGMLSGDSFPEFLRVFWNSRNRLVRKADLFKTIRRQITTRQSAFDLLRSLDESAEAYAALRDPGDHRWETSERDALQHLQMFNVRQPIAFLLTCYERFFEHDRSIFQRVLKAVQIISFRYNVICNLQTHEQERVYNQAAVAVHQSQITTLNDILYCLREIYPNDERFCAAFRNKELRTGNARNRKVIRYILFSIEAQQSNQRFDFEDSAYTLEHILPENSNDAWSDIPEVQQERLIYRLGNMTLLESTQNRDLGNSNFDTKRSVYETSSFHITRAIAQHNQTWDEKRVDARQKRLASIAKGIWSIPTLDQ